MSNKSIVFAGTPDFAATILERLLADGHIISAVYTQPDRKSGRGRKLVPGPVKVVALQHNLPVYQPLSLRDADAQQQLKTLSPEVMIVAAYGLILPQVVLDTPRLGCINVHASLLPRWRGAAPIQRAIQAGDEETGITLMKMEAGLDTGPMLAKAITPIEDCDTGSSLHDKLAQQGAALLSTSLPHLPSLLDKAESQSEPEANYAHKLSKEDGRINWHLSGHQLELQIRAFNSWPVAFTQLRGTVIRIWQGRAESGPSNAEPGTIVDVNNSRILVACKEGLLALTNLQMPGKRAQCVDSILNGHRELFSLGQRFSSAEETP